MRHASGNIDDVENGNLEININPSEECIAADSDTYMHEVWHLMGSSYDHILSDTGVPDYAVTCTYQCIDKLSYVSYPSSVELQNKMKNLCLSDENPYSLNHILSFVQYYNFENKDTYRKNFSGPFIDLVKDVQTSDQLKQVLLNDIQIQSDHFLNSANSKDLILNDIICEKSGLKDEFQIFLKELIINDKAVNHLFMRNLHELELEINCHAKASDFLVNILENECNESQGISNEKINALLKSLIEVDNINNVPEIKIGPLLFPTRNIMSIQDLQEHTKSFFYKNFKLLISHIDDYQQAKVDFYYDVNDVKSILCATFNASDLLRD